MRPAITLPIETCRGCEGSAKAAKDAQSQNRRVGLASATTSAASHWIIFFLNGRSALRDIALGGMPKHPHARRFSFVPASPVVRERFRTRCELSRTDAGSAPTVQRIKPKGTQNGNPGLIIARACALSVSVPINFYLRSCYDREPHRSASLRKSPNPIKQRFHFRTGGRKQCGVCPLATQRKQSDVRQHNYKMRNSEVANRAVLFRSIR